MHHPDTTNAAKQISSRVPIVARIERSTVDAGRETFQSAANELPTLQAATDLGDAARKACGAAG